MEGKYLITSDEWFMCPDGKDYKAAWGEVEVLEDDFLGIKTNRNSTNWYLKIGSESNHVIIAGCHIHYAVRCEETPYTEYGKTWNSDPERIMVHKTPSKIYIAE